MKYSNSAKKKKKQAIIYLITGIIITILIGVIYFAWPKNKWVENKKQKEKTSSWSEIQQLQTELNSIKSKFNNLLDNTQKTQLRNKLSSIESQVNNLSSQNNSLSQSVLKELEAEIKEIKIKIESYKPNKDKNDKPDDNDKPNDSKSQGKFAYDEVINDYGVFYYAFSNINLNSPNYRIILVSKNHPQLKKLHKDKEFIIHYGVPNRTKTNGVEYYFDENNQELEIIEVGNPNPQKPGDKYPALTVTKNEREYQKGENDSPLPISSVGCGTDRPDMWDYTEGHLMAGSALMTDTLDGSGSGSSLLSDKGITHIIHAINQPCSAFDNNERWFINYVVRSVQNSIILADRYKFEKLAIPFVGGGTYLGSCDPIKLAEGIMRGSVNQLAECQNLRQIILLDWHNSQTSHQSRQVFLSVFSKLQNEGWFGRHLGGDEVEIAENSAKTFIFDWGDIRDKRIHGASVIINAANTQVKFGSGISGAIAEQVGDKTKIEAEAHEWIDKFNS